jgi:hypothetical protein
VRIGSRNIRLGRRTTFRMTGLPRGKGRRRLRWGLAAASAGLVASGVVVLAGGADAHAQTPGSVSPGQGSSYAQSIQVTPHEGSLAVGAVLGEALAGHTGDYARAQSQGLDLGAVGTSIKSYNCGQPPNSTAAAAVPSPLEVETGQPGAAQGVTDTNPQQTYGATEYAQATSTPYAEADTTYGDLNGQYFVVAGAHSRAWSGIVDGQRVAGATSDISQLSIAGGAVVLDGLRWSSVYPSTGSAQPSGSFSLGSAEIMGKAAPTADLSALQNAANTVLGVIGVQLQLPQVTDAGGIVSVSPLQVVVVPSSTRDALLDGVLNAIAPQYNQLANDLENGFSPSEPSNLQQALCQSDTPITVADVALASIDGSGFFNAALGGVNASSSDLASNPFTLGLPSFSFGSPGSTVSTPGSAPSSGVAAVSAPLASGSGLVPTATPAAAATGATAGSASGAAPNGATQEAVPASAGFASGGPLLALGLAGLGATLLLAALERRAMKGPAAKAAFED